MNHIHLCLACDDNYAKHCAVTVASIIKNVSTNNFLHFYIMSSSLSSANKRKIQKSLSGYSDITFLDIDETTFANCPIRSDFHLTVETYFRLKIASLFPNLDKILYLDSDIVVLGDISQIWKLDIDDCYIACVPDAGGKKYKKIFSQYVDFDESFLYYNAGVLLVNLKKWRSDEIEFAFFEHLNNYKETLLFADQDVLNCVINKNIRYLDKIWNVQLSGYNSLLDGAKIIHYVSGNKPWNLYSCGRGYRLYYEYLRFTDWWYCAFFMRVSLIFKQVSSYLHNVISLLKINLFYSEKKFFIWGASSFISELLSHFPVSFFKIDGFFDADPEKQANLFCGYKVYPPSELDLIEPDVIVSGVLNNSKFENFIASQLENKNVRLLKGFFVIKR